MGGETKLSGPDLAAGISENEVPADGPLLGQANGESVLLVRAGSESEALATVGDDIYLRNGIWVELRARPFGRIVIPADGRS